MEKKTRVASSANKEAIDFAEAVTAARASLCLTQSAFARLLETPIGTVRGWEQGRRKPPPCALLLMRIAVDHPSVITDALGDESERKTSGQRLQTPKRRAGSLQPDQVEADLHEPGDEADFWLL
jgi:putative transcriptional regulator